MLKASVSVGVAVSKLVSVILSVKAKSKWHDIVLPVVWAAIVIHIFRGYSLPKKQKQHIYIHTLTYIHWHKKSEQKGYARFKFPLKQMKCNSLNSSGAGEQIPEPAFWSIHADNLHARGPCTAQLLCRCASCHRDCSSLQVPELAESP